MTYAVNGNCLITLAMRGKPVNWIVGNNIFYEFIGMVSQVLFIGKQHPIYI